MSEKPGPVRFPDGLPAPRFRATIADQRLQVATWSPHLRRIAEPESGRVVPDGVMIADLWVAESSERRELIARWLAPPADPERCPRPLRAWATYVGYTRLWLPSGPPLELDRAEASTAAPIRCSWCSWRPAEPSMVEWMQIQAQGIFPTGCPLCGNQVPQWVGEVDEALESEGSR